MASSLVGGGEGAAQPMEAERGTRAPGEEFPEGAEWGTQSRP